jgi:hypothetical protein
MARMLVMAGVSVMASVFVRDLGPAHVVIVLLVTHCCPAHLGRLREGYPVSLTPNRELGGA